MFQKYANPITEILLARGTFDTSPEKTVLAVLETLSGLMIADQIVTQSEVADLASVEQAQGQNTRSVITHLVDGLHFIQDIKLMSSAEPDLAQGLRDAIWRGADVVQQEMECALGHIDQRELDGWKDTRA